MFPDGVKGMPVCRCARVFSPRPLHTPQESAHCAQKHITTARTPPNTLLACAATSPSLLRRFLHSVLACCRAPLRVAARCSRCSRANKNDTIQSPVVMRPRSLPASELPWHHSIVTQRASPARPPPPSRSAMCRGTPRVGLVLPHVPRDVGQRAHGMMQQQLALACVCSSAEQS